MRLTFDELLSQQPAACQSFTKFARLAEKILPISTQVLNEKNDKQKTNGFHEMSIDVSLIDLSNRFNDSNLWMHACLKYNGILET